MINSSRFVTLKVVQEDYKTAVYIKAIRNPTIREVYTRLRIDMNILATSKTHGNNPITICSMCNNENETVEHFLLRCPKYQNIREEKFEIIAQLDTEFSNLNSDDKTRYLLALKCPETSISTCCSYIHAIYKQRETDNVTPG